MAGIAVGSILNQWQSRFEGRLVAPDEDAYDSSRRIWNGMINRRPALIA